MFNEKTSHTQPDDTSITQKETISKSNEKDEIWIELEDMSSQKKEIYCKMPWSNTENQKNHSNKNGEVTIQMYSDLKKAINNIDEDLNHFTLRYEKEKEVITSEIMKYIKNLANPIAEENKKLKEELETKIYNYKNKIINLKKTFLPLITKLRNWNLLYFIQPPNVKMQLKKQSSG